MEQARLKPGREKSVLRGHPWVFSGAVAEVSGSPVPGETLQVLSAAGEFLAWGAFSPNSQIRLRLWSWQEDQQIDPAFFDGRINYACTRRQELKRLAGSDALRLVYGEADGLPGLVVDRYGDFLVVQFLSSGVEFWRDAVCAALARLESVKGLYERSDVDVRSLEGLEARSGLLEGDALPEKLLIHEHGLTYRVDLAHGHKTGFYLDQRQNRLRLRDYTKGRDVLDCFSYTGGFALNALAGGAKRLTVIDSSAEALSIARENLQINRFSPEQVEWIEADVFQTLRRFRDQRRTFDLIILDPPKFAPTTSQVERAARAYKDINLLALKLLNPAGILFTFSCSGGVSAELFQKIVAGAAVDAGVDAQILENLQQDIDHPVALSFPESAYLKGLVLRKIDR